MGFLEDLVKTIQEAADEAKRRQGQLPPQARRPQPQPGDPISGARSSARSSAPLSRDQAPA